MNEQDTNSPVEGTQQSSQTESGPVAAEPQSDPSVEFHRKYQALPLSVRVGISLATIVIVIVLPCWGVISWLKTSTRLDVSLVELQSRSDWWDNFVEQSNESSAGFRLFKYQMGGLFVVYVHAPDEESPIEQINVGLPTPAMMTETHRARWLRTSADVVPTMILGITEDRSQMLQTIDWLKNDLLKPGSKLRLDSVMVEVKSVDQESIIIWIHGR